jgi:hypothetical protein
LLIEAFAADAADIAAEIGDRPLAELLTAHWLWSDWLRRGRIRKLAFVTEKTGPPVSRARLRGSVPSARRRAGRFGGPSASLVKRPL